MANEIQSTDIKPVELSPDFVPWGALTFLLSLAALCALLWFSVYFMMVERG